MATQAATASVESSDSSSSSNCSPPRSVRYKLPKAWAADSDRDSEEAVHRRVVGREAVRGRVLGDLLQTERLRVADQFA